MLPTPFREGCPRYPARSGKPRKSLANRYQLETVSVFSFNA
jgi:hypothetical protein